MGLFDHFPYTNVHELNLDWILSMMKALEAEWEAFTAGNSLTFADPLQHDISKTYAKNTIVLDGNGNAYVSLQAVPVGVGLQNGDYWLMVFDYEAFIEKVNKNFTAKYYRGSYRATTAIAIGDWLVVDDVLYKATAAIAVDDLLEIDVNIEHFTVEDFIKTFMLWTTDTIQQYKNDIDLSEYNYQLAMQAEVDRILAGATVDSEVIDARTTWFGYTFTTLGEELREILSDLSHADKSFYLTASDFIQGNIDTNPGHEGVDPSATYAIYTPAFMLCDRKYIKVECNSQLFYFYFSDESYGAVNSEYNNTYLIGGDYSDEFSTPTRLRMVCARYDLANISPSDLTSEDVVIKVTFTDTKVNTGVDTYSRKGYKLIPNANTWYTLDSRTGEGILESIFIAGSFDIKTTMLDIIVDGVRSVYGYIYEMIGLRASSANTAKYQTKYFGKTGNDGGIYLNYKIPYYHSIEIKIWRRLGSDDYVWFNARYAPWHEIKFGDYVVPYGSRFEMIRKDKYHAASGEEFNIVQQAGHKGCLFGVFMLGKGLSSMWYMEGKFRLYQHGSLTPVELSTGTEDFFNGTYYFEGGTYFSDFCGCGYVSQPNYEFAAYRIFEPDNILFGRDGFRITVRNNDYNTEDSSTLQNPTIADYAYYVGMYIL